MLINNRNYRTIWLSDNKLEVQIIDQRYLPYQFIIETIKSSTEMAVAIKDMHLRGAPLIGVAAAYGLYLATLEARHKPDPDDHIKYSAIMLQNTRPTAINLKWAIDRVLNEINKHSDIDEKISTAFKMAENMADEDIDVCKRIGKNGVKIIENISKNKKGEVVNILTHCNAGALACIDLGTATAPIYEAKKRGIKIHVWIDETRPRNQGRLTSWELEQAGIDNTIIVDNAGGYLMQKGLVDMVIVGTDRTTLNGDVANKIGTYLKALAAKDNNIPFYVALPISSIDKDINNSLIEIPIEERDQNEVLFIDGELRDKVEFVRLFSKNAKAKNYGFDITPARLITGFITEKGIFTPENLKNIELGLKN
ncbi:MAG TPA: S-methyl-5-thioribose-1-phosphate isomerase [Spirochaetota bacterium]|nr:S-methyl-5-thioribose-1-phosphate isomerase [Spirochaetota bacterium]HOL57541.1 S-methyl-5-thioribose-1-phosphate isomerase [Spirochaetota bacterium]HPP05075.1 S-methyl-5-thioribose-1-phosphate isomerase [Spirochaetota bacterium]